MFGHDAYSESDSPDEHPSLRRRLALALLLGGATVAGAALLLAVLAFSSHPTVTGSAGTAATTMPTTASAQKTGVGDPPIYWQTIEQQIAAGLHLTVAQVKADLQPPAGQRDSPGIAAVAARQGVSPQQLRTIEINAIQTGHDLLVRMGILSRQGSDLGMQRIRGWDDATLNDHVTGWFLND